jgi:hypothetical protein
MIRLDRNNTSSTEFIVADGPTRNRAFSVSASPNELWVGRIDNVFYDPFPLEQFGISHLKKESGSTIRHHRSITSVVFLTLPSIQKT